MRPLTQFLRFVEAYGLRSLLFELLAANPRLLELIIKTFDASRYASDLLIRQSAIARRSNTPRRQLDDNLDVAAPLAR